MPMVPRDFTRLVSEIVPEVIADVQAFLGIEAEPVTFTQQPTVSPLFGTAGEVTFTATPGVLSDGSAPTRAWLLGGTTLATTPSYAPPSSVSGNVVYREYGPDGAVSDPISLTVAQSGGGTPTPTPPPGDDLTSRSMARTTLSGPLLALDGTTPTFAPLAGSTTRHITIDPTEMFQEWIGTGACMTPTSAFLIMTQLTPTQRATFLQDTFGTNGFSVMRVCMGDSDSTYRKKPDGSFDFKSYDDTGTDLSLANFSTAIDDEYLIPVMQQILAINPNLKVHGSTWTAPGRVKVRNSLLGIVTENGSTINNDFVNNPANVDYFARYIIRALQSWRDKGVPITWFSFNEPEIRRDYYPTMHMSGNDLRDMYLAIGPMLAPAGLATRLAANEDNWNGNTSLYYTALDNSQAAQYIDAIHFHGYGGNVNVQDTAKARYPNKRIAFTEKRLLMSQTGSAALQDTIGGMVIPTIRRHSDIVQWWGFALDQNGQPNAQSTPRRGVVTIRSDGTGTIDRGRDYGISAALGRYVPRGSRRIQSSTLAETNSGNDLMNVSFLKPNGDVVTLLYNCANAARSCSIVDAVTGRASSTITLAAYETAVFTHSARAAVGNKLPAPTGLIAITGQGVSWNAVAGAKGYQILRGTTASNLAPWAVAGAGTTSTPDTSGTAFFYAVRALGEGRGTQSAAVQAGGSSAILLGDLTLTPLVFEQDGTYSGTIGGTRPAGTTVTATSPGATLTVNGDTVTGTGLTEQGQTANGNVATITLTQSNANAANDGYQNAFDLLRRAT